MIEKIKNWIIKWFWMKPTSKPEPEKPIRLKATEVVHEYVVIKYHKQRINLHRREIPIWNRMNRKNRRAMARKFGQQEKLGQIRFENIDGVLTCIKNKPYGQKENTE